MDATKLENRVALSFAPTAFSTFKTANPWSPTQLTAGRAAAYPNAQHARPFATTEPYNFPQKTQFTRKNRKVKRICFGKPPVKYAASNTGPTAKRMFALTAKNKPTQAEGTFVCF